MITEEGLRRAFEAVERHVEPKLAELLHRIERLERLVDELERNSKRMTA
jgi:uncharacterized protein Yka (UPF0111/DUF47 family)